MSRASLLLYNCNRDRQWLGGRAAGEKCELHAELLARTASHAYFAQVVSTPETDTKKEKTKPSPGGW